MSTSRSQQEAAAAARARVEASAARRAARETEASARRAERSAERKAIRAAEAAARRAALAEGRAAARAAREEERAAAAAKRRAERAEVATARRAAREANNRPEVALAASELVEPRAPRAPRELKGHGTNASYARGCRCDDCTEAHKLYQREYIRRRRENGGVGVIYGKVRHGTPSGYQSGCSAKADCPASPTCAEASLAAKHRRRRAAGIPERVMVPSGPARSRVRKLMRAGMNTRQIAAAAGIGHTAVSNLAYGKRGRETPTVSSTTAERILAVK